MSSDPNRQQSSPPDETVESPPSTPASGIVQAEMRGIMDSIFHRVMDEIHHEKELKRKRCELFPPIINYNMSTYNYLPNGSASLQTSAPPPTAIPDFVENMKGMKMVPLIHQHNIK